MAGGGGSQLGGRIVILVFLLVMNRRLKMVLVGGLGLKMVCLRGIRRLGPLKSRV